MINMSLFLYFIPSLLLSVGYMCIIVLLSGFVTLC